MKPNLSEFLNEAKANLQEVIVLEKDENDLKLEVSKLKDNIEANRKALNVKIDNTLKSRMSELTKTYDAEINSIRNKLNKEKSSRKKEKNTKVKGRIVDETSELKSANKDIKRRIKDELKKEKVPLFCNSNLYYSIFFPRSLFDYLRLLILFIICYAVIPIGIYLLFFAKNYMYLILIYIVCVVVFGGIYILINNTTKLKHLQTLKYCQSLKMDIERNKKKIKLITKSIVNDRDDTIYELEGFDTQIKYLEDEFNAVVKKRQEAVDTFESTTKKTIVDELTNVELPKFNELESEYKAKNEQLQSISAKRKEKALYITDNYDERFNDLSYFTDSEGRFFIKACIVKKVGIGCLAFDGHFIRIHTEKSGYKDADMFMSFAHCDRYHDRILTQNVVLAAQ